MDFNDTPEEARFRAEARTWLEKTAPQFEPQNTGAHDPEDFADDLKLGKAWQAAKAAAGYAFITWPAEAGGRGGSAIEQVIYDEEEDNYSLPRNFFVIAPFAGPTLMAYATEEQQRRYIPKMMSGEEIWCQLFSEPAAGSDLAGIRTRAERVGDDWNINGQKVWNSGAHYADYAILVTRSDPGVQKHKGLTYFFIDMHSPGVEVQPIKQISGHSDFCEVFLKDVRVPDSQRLGNIGQGWRVALTTLMNERFSTGSLGRPDVDELLALAREAEIDGEPAIRNSAVRDRIAEWFTQSQGMRFTKYRTMTALSRGETPGPEASIGKLVNASKRQDMGSFGMDLADMGGIIVNEDEASDESIFLRAYLSAPGIRIAGGTDEIMRNIIAERVLGLPGDIRVDKELPFSELPTGV